MTRVSPTSPSWMLFASSAKHSMDAHVSYRRLLANFPKALDRDRYEGEARRWREAAWQSLADAREAKGLAG